MTLVIITGEIDLSVASMLGLSSVARRRALRGRAGRSRRRRLVALVVGALGGAFNGFLDHRRVGLPSLAVTIGTLALFRGLAVGMLGTTRRHRTSRSLDATSSQPKIAGTPIPSVIFGSSSWRSLFGVAAALHRRSAAASTPSG